MDTFVRTSSVSWSTLSAASGAKLLDCAHILKRISGRAKTNEITHAFKPSTAEAEEAVGDGSERDELYDRAVELVTMNGQASTSFLQRRLRVGYNRAARMIEMMEEDGIVAPADGAKPREVLVRKNMDGTVREL